MVSLIIWAWPCDGCLEWQPVDNQELYYPCNIYIARLLLTVVMCSGKSLAISPPWWSLIVWAWPCDGCLEWQPVDNQESQYPCNIYVARLLLTVVMCSGRSLARIYNILISLMWCGHRSQLGCHQFNPLPKFIIFMWYSHSSQSWWVQVNPQVATIYHHIYMVPLFLAVVMGPGNSLAESYNKYIH
jgi:hypothetical protein